MNILIAPDSFKGSLTSKEICEILAEGLSRLLPDANITSIPIADGGEGTLDAFNAARPGQIVYAKATDSWFNEIKAPYLFYGNNPDSKQGMHGVHDKHISGIPTAVIESAKVAGYISPSANNSPTSNPDIHEQATSITNALTQDAVAPDPKLTTTYGVGLLIRDAISRGAKKIIVGLGGSSTNDGGCGMAAALGTRFYGVTGTVKDQPSEPLDGGTFIPTGGTFIPAGGMLSEIAHIDNRETMKLLGGARSLFEGRAVDIIGMCDVNNPLCGETGASHVFGPQKGASEEDVILLDEGLRHLVSIIDDREAVAPGTILFPRSLKAKALANLPGSGAAGGLGLGIRAFAGGRLERGIELMLETADFDRQLWNADFVITGEGRLDAQSLNGKVVSGICNRAEANGVNTIILCGTADNTAKAIIDRKTSAIQGSKTHIMETGFIDFANLTGEEVKNQAKENLINAIPHLVSALK